MPLVEDINEKPGEGFFPMPLSQDMTTRASSAHAYLTEAVRRRPNLRIMADACVTALQFDGLRAKGASVDHAGNTVEIVAREIILCAGAIHSPTILLRAGIGPADELQKIGITPRLDRPGVGRNLQNHPYLHFALTLPRQSRLQNTLRRFAIAGARVSSKLPEPHGGLVAVHDRPCQPTQLRSGCCDGRVRALRTILAGKVSLASAQTDIPPRIEFRLFEDPRDPPRMLVAARFAEALLCAPRRGRYLQ